MRREPYEAVEKSKSPSGDIVEPPANGEAIEVRLSDDYGDYWGLLIEWQANPGTWISGDNNVPLNEKI